MTPAAMRMAQWLESAWLARYLDRELSEDESAWFEAYAMDKPGLLAAIDSDSRLRDALAMHGATAQANLDKAPIRVRPSSAASRLQPTFRRLASIAASLVIGLAAGTLMMRSRAPMDESAVIGTSARVFIDVNRGVGNDAGDARNAAPRSGETGKGSIFIVVDVAVPPDSRNVKLLIDHREVASIERAKEGDATFVLRRALIEARPLVQLSYESDRRAEVRELSVDALLAANTDQ